MAQPTVTASGATAQPSGHVSKWRLQDAARGLLPGHRIGHCHRSFGYQKTEVVIMRDGSAAWFGGLLSCNSVWACPVCAHRISLHRQSELQKAVDNAIAYGQGVQLVTYTYRHNRDMPLADSLERFTKAQRRLKSGRAYKQVCADFGLQGEVRCLEVTHGLNGWHPHTHAITFSRHPLDKNTTSRPRLGQIASADGERERYTVGRLAPLKGHRLVQLKRRLFVLWYRACQREGLPLPSYRHGVDVRPAKYAADYIVKWGFAAELTRAHMKKGRDGGRSPWDLLRDASTGDQRAGWLFREFVAAFKGKRQLFWSRGLRARLGLGDELTDQEVMELEPAEAVEVARLTRDDWALVLRSRSRGELLELASQHPDQIGDWLADLRNRWCRKVGAVVFGMDDRGYMVEVDYIAGEA